MSLSLPGALGQPVEYPLSRVTAPLWVRLDHEVTERDSPLLARWFERSLRRLMGLRVVVVDPVYQQATLLVRYRNGRVERQTTFMARVVSAPAEEHEALLRSLTVPLEASVVVLQQQGAP